MSDESPRAARRTEVWRHGAEPAPSKHTVVGEDFVTVEEPFEIRLRAGEATVPLAVTMRTPGEDRELALGFLFSEGLVRLRRDVLEVRDLEDAWGEAGAPSNVLEVVLAGEVLPNLSRLERHFFASSACGVCGRAGIASLRLRGLPAPDPDLRVPAPVLLSLPAKLRAAQSVFAATGGLHAAAAFSVEGELLALREDVGRHNALDKLLGWAFSADRLPLSSAIVLLSGRASFELVQKCAVAGVSVIASVSAPSSLALELARETGTTLIGFLREARFNVYHGRERVILGEGAPG